MIPFHPTAELFPLLEGIELDDLAEDIRQRGLIEPILTYNGAILDGRNRLTACEKVGVEPRFCEFTGDDPEDEVISRNLRRRHLNESQRAMVAARLAPQTLAEYRQFAQAYTKTYREDKRRAK